MTVVDSDRTSERPSRPTAAEVPTTAEADKSVAGEPQGGSLTVWPQVVGAHIAIFNTFGYQLTWRETQSHYAETLGCVSNKLAGIMWLQILGLIVGVAAHRGPDAGDFRCSYAAGTLLLLLGILTASPTATSYWALFFSQGVCVGIANALLSCYALGLAFAYYGEGKSFASGFALAGAPTGGVVLPLVIRRLLPMIGFAGAMGVVGLVNAVTMLCSFLILKPGVAPRKVGSIV